MTRAFLPLVFVLAAGCGATPQPSSPSSATNPAPTSSPAPAASASAADEPKDNFHCGNDASSCATKGTLALLSSNAKVEGRAMLEKACALGSQNGCTNLGKALYSGAGGAVDQGRALGLWEKACDAGEGDACDAFGSAALDRDPSAARKAFERGCSSDNRESCAGFALMAAKGDGGSRDDRAAAQAAEKSCKRRSPLGCLIFGVMARDGQGTAKDPSAAKAALRVACQGGRKEGCDAEREVDATSSSGSSTAGKSPKGSTMTADAMTVDGMKLKSLSCDLSKGSPFALLGIAGSIRARKTQLDSCSPKSTETSVSLQAKNGRFTSVEATGSSASVKKCVERALVTQPTVFDGTCTTTIVHGGK